MSKIPGYRHRLKAMLFKLHFADKLEEIKPVCIKQKKFCSSCEQTQQTHSILVTNDNILNFQELERVVKASQELRESKQLQQVLQARAFSYISFIITVITYRRKSVINSHCFPQLVLAFGNYMNQGNARIAGASAFRVGFLAKVGRRVDIPASCGVTGRGRNLTCTCFSLQLSSTKTSDNKSNLLKFLVKTVDAKCPEVLDLKSELTSIPLAARGEMSFFGVSVMN
jgi:hypothetical protein